MNIMIFLSFLNLFSSIILLCTSLFLHFWAVFSGGNFCAGYDLKELSQDSVSLTLEQNVSRGPAPMVRGGT